MNRFLVVSLLVMLANGCTCAGCEKKPEVPALSAMDASVAKIDAAADAGRELPYEVTSNAKPDAELIAKYAADCHAEILVTFDDMDGEKEMEDCKAIAMDQNCAPDLFGCWEKQEACVASCAQPCGACQDACAEVCDACKGGCDGGTCANDCAKARFNCRNECLYGQSACRSACFKEGEVCGDLGEERVKQQCPDCDAINQCLWDHMKDSPEARAKCLKPGNAHECLEWCFEE